MRVPAGYYLPEGQEPAAAPKRKPARRKPKDLEAGIQGAILKFLKLALPGAVIHASPNGAVLAGNSKARSIAMAQLKAAGMLVGYPDLCVLWRGQAWYFECKRPGEKPTEAQVEVGERLERNGGRWAVVRSVTDAESCVREWRGDIDG